jgi:hypothetical protein
VKKHLLLLGIALAASPALYAQNEIGEVFSSDASVRGSVVLSGHGAHVLSGSQVSAGDGVALLKLERGGELRICPKTNLSLSVDANGKSLVVGMNVGAVELNYSLESSSDSVITPDFRLQLISPGSFHLAISVARSGDTCMRSLPGNDASVFVAEMMGNGAYQLSPGKSALFKSGRISGLADAPAVCGCPKLETEAPAPILTNQGSTASAGATATASLAPPATAPAATPAAVSSSPPAATPASNAREAHLEVEGSFVYRGNEAVQDYDYYVTVSRLSLSADNSRLALALLPQVSGPVAETKPQAQNSGFLHRLGRFLARLVGK